MKIKKIICKCSVILPILTMLVVLRQNVRIGIPEIRLYFGELKFLIMFSLFTVIWLSLSSLRNNCCNGKWSEFSFYVIPFNILGLLVFAQWHFRLTVIILAVIMLLSGIIIVNFLRKKGNRRYSSKRLRYYRKAFQRKVISVIAVSLAIPSLLSTFVYDLGTPVYSAEQRLMKMLYEYDESLYGKNETEDIYEQNKELLVSFDQKKWKKFDIHEKISLAQEFVNFECAVLGIPKIMVKAQKLGDTTLGEYDRLEKEIIIDVQNLEKHDCLRTLAHETFHAAQYYVVENINWDSEISNSVFFDEFRSWKENQENYISPDLFGIDNYRNQPVEASANEYAEKEIKKIRSYIDENSDRTE